MSAYIIPFDHNPTGDVVPGLNPAELWATTPTGEKLPKVGTTRTFFNTPASKITALSSLGEGFAKKDADAKRELLRKSVGGAVKELKAMDGLKDVTIDASIDPHAAGIHNILYERCNELLICFL
jgi:aminopeptidase